MGKAAAKEKMPTSVAGNSLLSVSNRLARSARVGGFTLLELMVVVAIVAVAGGLAVVALRDSSDSQLEQEGQRLAALFDGARARSRATGVPISWSTSEKGFVFEPAIAGANNQWRQTGTRAQVLADGVLSNGVKPERIILGPEPLIGAQSVRVSLGERAIVVSTDGIRPFQVGVTQALDAPK